MENQQVHEPMEKTQPQTNEVFFNSTEVEKELKMKKTISTDKLLEDVNETLEHYKNLIIPNMYGVENVFLDLKALTSDNDTNGGDRQLKALMKIIKKSTRIIKNTVSQFENVRENLEDVKKQVEENSSAVVTFNAIADLEDLNHNNITYTDSDAELIDQTFEDSKILKKDFSDDSNIHVVRNLKNSFAEACFDTDPELNEKPLQAKIKEMAPFILRGEMDESGEKIVTYSLPTEVTVKKLRQDIDKNSPHDKDNKYEYNIISEYNLIKEDKDDNYVIVTRPDGLFFNKLETRMSLSERQPKMSPKKSNINTKFNVQYLSELSEQVSEEAKETATNDSDTNHMNVSKVSIEEKKEK